MIGGRETSPDLARFFGSDIFFSRPQTWPGFYDLHNGKCSLYGRDAFRRRGSQLREMDRNTTLPKNISTRRDRAAVSREIRLLPPRKRNTSECDSIAPGRLGRWTACIGESNCVRVPRTGAEDGTNTGTCDGWCWWWWYWYQHKYCRQNVVTNLRGYYPRLWMI